MSTTTTNLFASIGLPTGATTDDEGWTANLSRPGYSRSLYWASFAPVGRVSADIDGRQESDGSYTCGITLWTSDDHLDADQARRVAAMLIEAADELDGLGSQ